jgi:hypothetical protein
MIRAASPSVSAAGGRSSAAVALSRRGRPTGLALALQPRRRRAQAGERRETRSAFRRVGFPPSQAAGPNLPITRHKLATPRRFDPDGRRDTDASFDAVALEVVRRRRERFLWARSLPRPTRRLEDRRKHLRPATHGWAVGSASVQSRPKDPNPSGSGVRSGLGPARSAIRPARATRARVPGRSPPFATGNRAWRACCGRACRRCGD